MSNKFFDIIPPGENAPEGETPKLDKKDFSSASSFKKKCNLSKIKKICFIFLAIFSLLAIFCYFKLPKAQIVIYPESKNISFEREIILSQGAAKVDLKSGVVPAKIIEDEKEASQKFPASKKEKKETKAEGIIRVFNNYSTKPQVLVATTRFISADGKLFRSLERVVVPGEKFVKGKLTAGWADVRVRAAVAGPDYNIGPTTFSIPGFQGTAKYTAFYGKSYKPMKGGFVGEVPVVTENDLENANKILLARLFEQSENSLKDKISSDFLLLEGSLEKQVIEAKPLIEPGTEAETFVYQAKVKSRALVFSKKDIQKFIEKYIYAHIDEKENKEIYLSSLTFTPSLKNLDMEAGEALINLKFSAIVYNKVPEKILRSVIAGKSFQEGKMLLENRSEIKEVQIKLWPFWVRSIPSVDKRIKIELNIK